MNEYRLTARLMGSSFELLLHHDNEERARELLDMGVREIERIEDLLSEFREHTYTSKINQSAGLMTVKVNQEVYNLLERALRISLMTDGAFDITVGPLKKLYKFKNGDFSFPSQSDIQQALSKVGYDGLRFGANYEVFLCEQGMSISFAAIGKGYAADRVKKLWLQHGVTSGVVSASGDLTTIGCRADGSSWTVGIADPDNKDNMLFYIPVKNASVATSGDYEQYFMWKGTRYSHNINPITGTPVSGIKSVSVVSPMAELSDALATAVYVMGIEAGLHFINQLPETHCIIIDDRNQAHFSKRIEILHEV